MKILKILSLAALSAVLLCGCAVDIPTEKPQSDSGKNAKTLNIAAEAAPVDESARLLRGNGLTNLEYHPLPALFEASADALREASNSRALLTATTDSTYLPKDVKKGIKITTNGQDWAQVLVASNASGKEGMLVDPCPDSLEGYDGLYLWVDIRPRTAGQVIPNKFIVMLFNWDFGYRDMFEFSFDVPSGGYTGYIQMPFSEFVSGYDQSQKYCVPVAIDGIGFRMNASDKMSFLDIYIADLQAYREVFW